MIKVHIEFFGRLSDRFGKTVVCDVPTGGETIAQLRAQLAKEHDCDELSKSLIRAVLNDKFAAETDKIAAGDTVAFLSPLSGG